MKLIRTLRMLIMPAITIVIGFLAIFWLSGFIERNRPPLQAVYEDSDLSMNGSRLKGYACGFEGLMADWYWMRSLQYIGDKLVKSEDEFINIDDLRSLNPRLLYPYLNNATELDPGFIAAYTFGALVLPAIDPDKAIDLTNKGIANNPNEWRLYQHLAYIYWRLGQFEKAAEIYGKGAQVAGAQPFMKMMAASMKTEGGSRATARYIYRQMLNDADPQDVQTIRTAQIRLLALDATDEREAIRGVLADFKEKTGRCAENLKEILPLLRGIKLPEGRDFRVNDSLDLVDPSDAPYLLDKENCDVKLDPVKTKLPLK